MRAGGAIAWSGLTALFWACIWVLLRGQLGLGALTFALVLGIVTSHFASRRAGYPRGLLGAASGLLHLGGIFLRELAVSNLQQLRIVLGPRIEIDPRWIEVETKLETDFGRALLAVLVSMTPGTLTCEVRASKLLVHVLDTEDPEDVALRIRERLEAPIARLEGFRVELDGPGTEERET